VNTGFPKSHTTGKLRGWVLYDGECAFCTRWIVRMENTLMQRGFGVAPRQAPWIRECLGRPIDALPDEMILLTPAGRIYGGADALVLLAQTIWWAWPVYAAAQITGVKRVFRVVYRWVAKRRHCLASGDQGPGLRGRRHGPTGWPAQFAAEVGLDAQRHGAKKK